MTDLKLAIVEEDYSRRAQIVWHISNKSWHIEPFEHISEFRTPNRDRWLFLVHDAGRSLGEVLRYRVEHDLTAAVIAYSDQPDADTVVKALKLGAFDYFDLTRGLDELSIKVPDWHAVAEAELPRLERRFASARLVKRLTRREREVLTHITMGHSTKAISERLCISDRTVELHRSHVLQKLVATNSSDAVRIAMEAGIHS